MQIKKKTVVFKEKLCNINNENLLVTIWLSTSDYNKSDMNCANLERKKNSLNSLLMNMETNYISHSFRQINNYERMILRKLKPIY